MIMNPRPALVRAAVAAAVVLGGTASAWARVARVGGIVRDEGGQPIKGATIRAENPDAPLGSLTAATDDKGRFAIIGLARGAGVLVPRRGAGFPPAARRPEHAPPRPPPPAAGVRAAEGDHPSARRRRR